MRDKSSRFNPSRKLTTYLRHRSDLSRDDHGFVSFADLMKYDKIFTVDLLLEIAQDHQRYILNSDATAIKCHQGHSVPTVLSGRPLDAETYIAHGTNIKSLAAITASGLSRMARTHIHFCSGASIQEVVNNVKNKGKTHANCIIVMDTNKCRQSGIEFTICENGTVLSPGNDQGYIPPDCIYRVIRL